MSSHPFSHLYKTLYERLDPEVKDHMESQARSFPLSVESIRDALKNNVVWRDLSVSDVDKMIMFSGVSMFCLNQEKYLDVFRNGAKILKNASPLLELK